MAGGGGFLAFLNETQSEFQIRFFSPLTFPFLSTFVASSVETGDDSRNEKMGRVIHKRLSYHDSITRQMLSFVVE